MLCNITMQCIAALSMDYTFLLYPFFILSLGYLYACLHIKWQTYAYVPVYAQLCSLLKRASLICVNMDFSTSNSSKWNSLCKSVTSLRLQLP